MTPGRVGETERYASLDFGKRTFTMRQFEKSAVVKYEFAPVPATPLHLTEDGVVYGASPPYISWWRICEVPG